MLNLQTKLKIKKALKEDIKNSDITTSLFVDPKKLFFAVMRAKSPCVVCGIEMAAYAFKVLNPKATVNIIKKDGQWAFPGDILMTVKSDRSVLSAERTALNIVQRLSAISLLSRKVSQMAKKTTILDTRKTTPLWRLEEKYAVKVGGASNHRFGLYDAFLIKDNHISAIGSFEKLAKKIDEARKKFPSKKIEIEAQNLSQVQAFASLKPDIIMLDNMNIPEMKKAIKIIRKTSQKTKIELSGSIRPNHLPRYLKIGADYISMGCLTHSISAADICLEIEDKNER